MLIHDAIDHLRKRFDETSSDGEAVATLIESNHTLNTENELLLAVLKEVHCVHVHWGLFLANMSEETYMILKLYMDRLINAEYSYKKRKGA